MLRENEKILKQLFNNLKNKSTNIKLARTKVKIRSTSDGIINKAQKYQSFRVMKF